VFIPLYQVHDSPGVYYVNDTFKFAGTPMRGKYNDYGIIEPVEKSESSDLTTSFFMKDIENDEITLKKDSCYKDDIKDCDGLVQALERERLRTTNPSGLKCTGLFSYILMHEGAFDLTVKEMGDRMPYEKKHNIRSYLEHDLKSVPENVKKHRKLGMPYFSRDDGARFLDDYFFVGQRWAEAITDNKASDLIKLLTDLYVFTMAMGYMRMSLMPTSGKGSQCDEMALHLKLCEFIQGFANKHREEWFKEHKTGDEYYSGRADPLAETPLVYGKDDL
jgi:hypothetical protein